MTTRSSLAVTLGVLLGSTAVLAPVARAQPATATVPDASAIKPVPPTPARAPGVAAPVDHAAPDHAAADQAGKPETSKAPSEEAMRAQRHADREAFFSAHLAALQAGLMLQPDQQALWKPVESAIRDVAKARAEHWRMRHDRQDHDGTADGHSDKDAVDRLLARGASMTAMGNAIQGLAHATAPLLASLTPEQKHRLPALVEGLKPRRLIAQAFDLDEDGAGRQGFEDGQGGRGRYGRDRDGRGEDAGTGDGRDDVSRGGLMYNEGGRQNFMQRERGPSHENGRDGQDGGYARSGGMGSHHQAMPEDDGDR